MHPSHNHGPGLYGTILAAAGLSIAGTLLEQDAKLLRSAADTVAADTHRRTELISEAQRVETASGSVIASILVAAVFGSLIDYRTKHVKLNGKSGQIKSLSPEISG